MSENHSEMLWEDASIEPEDSGIPVAIWVSNQGHASHGCRIKISNSTKWTGDSFTVTVPDCKVVGAVTCSSKVLEKIFVFMRLNTNDLLLLWDQKISYKTFLINLKKV